MFIPGATPARQQYRFPRALAATSPHERILARYRDMPRQREQQVTILYTGQQTNKSPQPSSSVCHPQAKKRSIDSILPWAMLIQAMSNIIGPAGFYKSIEKTWCIHTASTQNCESCCGTQRRIVSVFSRDCLARGSFSEHQV